MGFSLLLLLIMVLLLPFALCEELNLHLSLYDKLSDKQKVLTNVHTIVIVLVQLDPITAGFHNFYYDDGVETMHDLSWCFIGVPPPTALNAFSMQVRISKITSTTTSIATRSWFNNFCYFWYDTNGYARKKDTDLVEVGHSEEMLENHEHQSDFLTTVRQVLNVLKLAAMLEKNKFVTGKIWFYAENLTVHGQAQCKKDLMVDELMQALFGDPAHCSLYEMEP